MEELREILKKFALCGWNLISIPSQEWLDGEGNIDKLISSIEQADLECGNCGCEFDPLYKKALELLKSNK